MDRFGGDDMSNDRPPGTVVFDQSVGPVRRTDRFEYTQIHFEWLSGSPSDRVSE